MTTDDDPSLEEQLRFYDDDFPREDPTWGEDAVVTPRAFLSEYGYDVDGRQIPTDLGQLLVDRPSTEPAASVYRTFSPVEDVRDIETEDGIARMLDVGGLNSVEVFYVPTDTGGEVASMGAGGFLVRYSYIRSDDRLERTGHDQYGYYWMGTHALHRLIHRLLNETDRSVLTEGEDNPAEGETWVAARCEGTALGSLREVIEDNLLFGEDVPREPISKFEEIQRADC